VDATASITNLANQPAAKFAGGTVNSADRSSVAYGVTLQQLIFDSGASGSTYRAAKNYREIKRLTVGLTKNVVVLSFIAAYFDLLESEKIAQVAETEKEELEGHLQTAQHLYDEGVITKNDLLQAKVQLADAGQKLITTGNARAVGAARVNNILSRPLQEKFQAVESENDGFKPPDLTQAWQEAEEHRAELKILDYRAASAGLQKKAKQAEFLPRVFVQAGYEYAENEYLVHQDNWFTTLNFDLNIFNGGATAAEVKKISKQQQEIVQEIIRVKNDIRLEVEKYFLDFKNAEEKLAAVKDAVGQAEENLKINKVRYQEGTGSATEVLDAITLLAVAQINNQRALYDMKRAHAGLLYATGRDLAAEYGAATAGN
jgi:outer membrane protein TolC